MFIDPISDKMWQRISIMIMIVLKEKRENIYKKGEDRG